MNFVHFYNYLNNFLIMTMQTNNKQNKLYINTNSNNPSFFWPI